MLVSKRVTEGHVWLAAKPMLHRAKVPVRDFISLFGVNPNVVAVVYNITPFPPDIRLHHVLWALSFLKTYETEANLMRIAGGMVASKKTYRKKVRSVLQSFFLKTHQVIKLSNRFKRDRGKTCKMSVDGTDCLIPRQKPHARDRRYYSHKFKHAAFRYEVAVCIQTGEIVWFNGPFPAGAWPDVNIYRRDLKQALLHGEMVEADRGYRDATVRSCDVVVSKSDARAKSRVMWRHETINGGLKDFGCLKQQWRHDLNDHILAFSSCVLLLHTSNAVGDGPKFHVKY